MHRLDPKPAIQRAFIQDQPERRSCCLNQTLRNGLQQKPGYQAFP
uniref:Uncharacterized protein n=1 Tax=uncultured Rhodospirillales bacterium HF4000_24M03 TaxID=710788 RepID=E0XW20_9PROT|nr:hypothetical protein [uncultured Rhodospirillales bacterium HF4000_24M03]